MPRLSMGAVT